MDYKIYNDRELLNLPVELLNMIVAMLDFESKLKLAATCAFLRDLVFPGIIKIEKDTLKSAGIFASDGFPLIASRIAESIDLSSIMDFSQQSCRGLQQMINVRRIDLSNTNLNFENVMASAPPSLEDVTLNLTNFDSNILSRPTYRKQVFSFFERITNIHFKLRRDFCDGPTYPYDACLMHQNIKVSYLGQRALSYSLPKFGDCMKYEPNFRMLTFSLNLSLPIKLYIFLYNLSLTNLDLLIYNFDQENDKLKVMMAQEVANALNNTEHTVKIHKHITSVTDKDKIIDSIYYGHVKLICWNKKVIGDDDYYAIIVETIKRTIPSHVCVHSHKVRTLIKTSNRHCIVHDCVNTTNMKTFPVNFDLLLKPRYKIITILRECFCGTADNRLDTSTLEPTRGIFFNNNIRNLTFLSLDKVNFLDEVWERLFFFVPNLVTLNIIGDPEIETTNFKGLAESVHLSKRLKHIKLLEVGLDCNLLFKAFSKCTQLETIYLDSIHPVAKFDNEIKSYINLVLGCKKLTVLALENVYDDDRKHIARINELIQHFSKEQKRKPIEFISITLSIYTNDIEHVTDRFCADNIIFL